MKCPYCAEELQPDAAKCKHCGEWLDRSRVPVSSSTWDQPERLDNSRINLYFVCIEAPGQSKKYLSFTSADRVESEAQVRALIEKKYPGWNIDEEYGIRIKNPGKYSCPNCKFKYTECKRDVGCAIMIIIFISFGLGLIMVPFLPYHCKCQACGYSWKA